MQFTYKESGVDIEAGADLVRRIAPAVKKTQRPEQLTGLGGFAALASLPASYREPVLVTGTDGVGTKLKLAIDANRHDNVGQDLVAMCANDVLVTGAEPFLFLDYYATSHLEVETATRVITGIARGCELAGCALVGGETAEMPGFYASGDYDLAGFCIGVVERSKVISGARLKAGDRIIGLASSGPHSNGYSLIRRVLEARGMHVARESSAPGPDSTDRPQTPAQHQELLDQLLRPTRIYASSVLQLARQQPIHAMAHITGGGLLENIPRMFQEEKALAAVLDLDSWQQPGIFSWLQQAGNISTVEMLRTFNCGIGFVICVPQEHLDTCLEILTGQGETARVIGRILPDQGLQPSASELVIRSQGFDLG